MQIVGGGAVIPGGLPVLRGSGVGVEVFGLAYEVAHILEPVDEAFGLVDADSLGAFSNRAVFLRLV